MDSGNCLYFCLKTWVGNFFSSLGISCQSFGPTYFKDFFPSSILTLGMKLFMLFDCLVLCLCIAEMDGGLVLKDLDDSFILCIIIAVSNLTRSLN